MAILVLFVPVLLPYRKHLTTLNLGIRVADLVVELSECFRFLRTYNYRQSWFLWL